MRLLWVLFTTFFQIGMFSIGGGYAVIPLIREYVVSQQGWITQKAFTDIITISQMTPGPLALNTSTFVGLQIAGLPGAVAATLGCVIPGVTCSLLLHLFFKRHRKSVRMTGALEGLKAASVGLIMSAGATILMLTFCGTFDWHAIQGVDVASLILFVIALYALRRWKMNPVLLMVMAGAAGYLLFVAGLADLPAG